MNKIVAECRSREILLLDNGADHQHSVGCVMPKSLLSEDELQYFFAKSLSVAPTDDN
jgi:hypothetical protein